MRNRPLGSLRGLEFAHHLREARLGASDALVLAMHSDRRVRELLVIASLCTACEIGSTDDDLDRSMLDRIARVDRMEHINRLPLGSKLGDFSIDCYVEGDAASYRRIHPELAGSHVTLQPGTLIVRAVHAANGQPESLTAMGKGPPGFDPRLGDWWFAVTDPRGVPLEQDGVVQAGRLDACHDCHRDRADDDFLFGVPASAL